MGERVTALVAGVLVYSCVRKGEGRYGQRGGLVNPEPVELDRLLRELCVSFAAKPVPEQTALRAAVSTDESYTLLCFARRSVVFALRDRDPGMLERRDESRAAAGVAGTTDG